MSDQKAIPKRRYKFTPGHWRTLGGGRGKFVVASDGKGIAYTSDSGRSQPQNDKNAQLIAAAPQMFYVLSFIYDGMPNALEEPHNDYVANEIRNVLNLALGESYDERYGEG